MERKNQPRKRDKSRYPTNEEYAYWVEQVRAGNETDYYYGLIVDSLKKYFGVIAKSFAYSTNPDRYEDLMQEGYLLIWKIIQKRSFRSFFPFCTQSYRYILINYYHQYMNEQLQQYHYLMETEGKVPWSKEQIQRLFDYSERRKEAKQQSLLRQKKRREEKQRLRERRHQYYLRYKETHSAEIEANKEKRREKDKLYYQKNREKINRRKAKYKKKHRKQTRATSRRYYKNNTDKILERKRKYYREHPEKFKEANRKYYLKHRQLKAPGSTRCVPYGFKKSHAKIWVVNKKQDYVVRFIFDWFISGYKINRIISLLKEQRILSPVGKDTWTWSTIYKILQDERYIGRLVLKPGTPFSNDLNEEVIIENYYPIIVSERKFLAAQDILRKHKQRSNYKRQG